MIIMNWRMNAICHRFGLCSSAGSTLSPGTATCDVSYRKIVQQNLCRQHGQKWQEERCRSHAEHIAEVGTGAHDDVLHDVGEAPPPLDYPLVQDRKVLLQQDDLRGIFSHIHAVHYGNADVRGVQRRSIVDAVTDVPDDVPAALQTENDPVLLLRRHSGKDGAVFGLVRQGSIVHGIDLVAGDDAVGRQPDIVGDLLRHVLVIAGHDDHGNAVFLQRIENCRDPLLGRVEECRKPGQRHLLLRRQRVSGLLLYLADGDSEGAESVGTQLLEGLLRLGSPAFIERLGNPVNDDSPADTKNALRLAFSNKEVLTTAVHHDRKALAVEVEGDLVYLPIFRDRGVLMLQDCVVQRALDARLKVTVQVDEAEDVLVVLTVYVHVAVKHNLALGQCSRLIAAKNLDAAEVLNCRKLFDQNLLPGHPARALRQGNRDDHWHHLRRHTDSQRD